MSEINFQIEETKSNKDIKCIIIKINGMLDESTADNFAPNVYSQIEKLEENQKLILDIENLSYMNSKSIGYFSDYYNKCIQKKANLVITKPAKNVLDVLETVGIDQIIPITQTNKEAINL